MHDLGHEEVLILLGQWSSRTLIPCLLWVSLKNEGGAKLLALKLVILGQCLCRLVLLTRFEEVSTPS